MAAGAAGAFPVAAWTSTERLVALWLQGRAVKARRQALAWAMVPSSYYETRARTPNSMCLLFRRNSVAFQPPIEFADVGAFILELILPPHPGRRQLPLLKRRQPYGIPLHSDQLK